MRLSIDRRVLRSLEAQLGQDVELDDGRRGALRVVDACGGRLSCCVELKDGRLVWIGSEELKTSDRNEKRVARAERQ